ncbi:hypothetical protein RI129_010899 [Pyrocoelia pectoralis]|uniref:G-protein coupled receptors family 2 profile 2 domain-containing protein n=1 Tax=Pyrocoelia pectoralis TaxID=417401 RepID=A0AAN7ZIB7_9COLE
MYLFIFAILLNRILVILSVCVPDTRHRSDTLAPDESSYDIMFFNKSYISDCGCDDKYTCVRKCCDEDYGIDADTLKCVRNESVKLSIPIYMMGNVIIDNDQLIDFRYVSGVSECLLDEEEDDFYFAKMDEFYIQKDGKLWMSRLNTYFKPEHYCIENDDDLGPVAVLCLLSYNVQSLEISARITSIGMIISLPFLLVTFIIYAVLPLRNLHGKSLMCYVFSLFTTYLLYVIIQLHPDADSLDAVVCKTIAMTFMYFFEASFVWMNVMCIDIYLTFSGTKLIISERKRVEFKRFIYYSIYAWGTPILLVVLVVVMSKVVKPNAWYNPGISDQQCWLNNGIPLFLYLYLPMAIVIVANIVLFAITAHKVRIARRDTAMLRTGENKSSNEETVRFGVYIKLFLCMGVNWSFEIITWAVDWQVENVPPAIWYVTDLCNALFGLFIFIIFVCNKKVWKLLKAKYYKITDKTPPLAPSSTDEVTLETY